MSEHSFMVSACIIVYNHEKYLTQCLDAAVNQKVNFKYEIVVGDDFSTDNSLEICKAYKQKYPHLIRLIERDRNLGMVGNWMSTIDSCKGKYIAICEGDDYWLDECRLQKQFDFMEDHPDFSACFGRCEVLNLTRDVEFCYPTPKNQILGLSDILNRNYIPTATLFFHKERLTSLPQYINSVMSLDIFLEILLAMHGSFRYFDEIFAVYRRHDGGITNTKEVINFGERKITEMYIYFFNHTSGAVHEEFRIAIAKRYLFIIHQLRQYSYFRGLYLLLKQSGNIAVYFRDKRVLKPLLITIAKQIMPFKF